MTSVKVGDAVGSICHFIAWFIVMLPVMMVLFVAVGLATWAKGLHLIWTGRAPEQEWEMPWSWLCSEDERRGSTP